jgi:hypothetical protein
MIGQDFVKCFIIKHLIHPDIESLFDSIESADLPARQPFVIPIGSHSLFDIVRAVHSGAAAETEHGHAYGHESPADRLRVAIRFLLPQPLIGTSQGVKIQHARPR